MNEKKEAPTDTRPAGANTPEGVREGDLEWARRSVARTLARCLMALSAQFAQAAKERAL